MSLRRLLPLSLFAAACTQLDESSITTSLGAIRNIEVEVSACDATLQRVVELDVVAQSRAVALEGLSISSVGLPDGDLQVTPVEIAAKQSVRIRCVDQRPFEGGYDGVPDSATAHVRVTLATEDDAVDPVLWGALTKAPQAFDNCGNVLETPGCVIVE